MAPISARVEALGAPNPKPRRTPATKARMSDPQMMVSLIAIAGHGGGKIQLPIAAATNGSIGPKPKIRLSVGIRGLFGRGIRPQRTGERVVALAAQATDFESFGPSITAKRYAADPSAESMMDTPETNIS